MTAGRIILEMTNPALDQDGHPYSQAALHFYQNGTTTEQDTFTDPTLTVPHTNPVVSDSAGRFPEIWADIDTAFSVIWKDVNHAVIYTFDNVLPLTAGVGTDGAGIDPVAFRDALGLGTAAREDTDTSGHNIPFLDAENIWSEAQHFISAATVNGEQLGYLDLVTVARDADHTLTQNDRDRLQRHTSGTAHTWTIPPNADEPAFDGGGAVVGLRNIGTGAVTIARGAGVTLRIGGASASANAALAQWGLAALINEDVDVWVIMGNGVS